MTIFSIEIFGLTIEPTYYWMMYALGFLAWYYIIKKRKVIEWKLLEDLFLYIFLWVILGWRFGYILFYDLGSFLQNPIDIIKVWEWWMSFHGWVIWVLITMLWFAKKNKINFYSLADQITAVLPIWIWLWRIGNYLNQELLWYSPYTWIFAVYKNWIWYFPSPLLEMFLEWIVLFFILNYVYYKRKFPWQIASLFLIFYAVFRIFVEIFFRQPDENIWYIFWFLTMWTILSLPMLFAWIYFYFRLRKWK